MWRGFAIGLALLVAAVSCEAASDDFVNDGEGQQPSVARAVRPAKIGDMSTYLRWKWRSDVTDPSTGLDNAALKQGLEIASIRRLRVGPPVTAFDVLQFCFVDFIVSEYFDRFQVRVAGWNIRWNDIPKREQDGFIRRLEALPR